MAELEIARKTSILSLYSEKFEEKRKSLNPAAEPKDPFFIVHLTCFFMGFMNLMPLLFFNTAEGYWMYKFRDPILDPDGTATENRTILQSYYQPVSTAASTVPNAFISIFFMIYGHKFSAMLRTIWSLFLMVVIFIVFAIFSQLDTDTWQVGFFILSMSLLILNSILLTALNMSSVVLLAKLPPKFTFCFLIGQNGTILTDLLQLLSVAVTKTQEASGLLYFSVGAILLAISLAMLMISRHSKLFKSYDVEDFQEQKPEFMTWAETKEILKKTWPCQVIIAFSIFFLACVHPSVTTLVVSQSHDDHTEWSDKYFTPICVFLLNDIGTLCGRLFGKFFAVTHSNKWYWMIFIVVRMVFFTLSYIFCNAQPRNLPVVFDKDWEFILLHCLMGFSMGICFNQAFLSLKSLAPDNTEGAFKLNNLFANIVGSISTFNGILFVKILKW